MTERRADDDELDPDDVIGTVCPEPPKLIPVAPPAPPRADLTADELDDRGE